MNIHFMNIDHNLKFVAIVFLYDGYTFNQFCEMETIILHLAISFLICRSLIIDPFSKFTSLGTNLK